MKIYKLTASEKKESNFAVLTSGTFLAPRTQHWEKYYLTKLSAELAQEQFYQAAKTLLGFIPNVECLITEIEVIE